MKTFRHFFLLLFTHAAGHTLSGQAIIDAYIIIPVGDSIKGQVKIPGDKLFGQNVFAKLGGGVEFKPAGGTFTYYRPSVLKEFGYYTGDSLQPVRRYSAEKVNKDIRLVIIELDGPLRLYKDIVLQKDIVMGKFERHTINRDYLYIKKKKGELLAVEDIFYEKEKHKRPLKEYLSGCAMLETIFQQKQLDLIKLVNSYNTLCQ